MTPSKLVITFYPECITVCTSLEQNTLEPICARPEEELQLAVNTTEWAKFTTQHWWFDTAAQVGFVLLWQAAQVKCRNSAYPKRHCHSCVFPFFVCFFFSLLLPWSIFTWREKIHKLWESDGAHTLAVLAFRGGTEISFMWRYDVVHVSCGNKRETVINNWNVFQIGSCYLCQPQKKKLNGRRYMSSRLVNTALGCISFPGSLNQ